MSEVPNYVKNCVTHHHACDCREYKFKQTKAKYIDIAKKHSGLAVEWEKLSWEKLALESQLKKAEAVIDFYGNGDNWFNGGLDDNQFEHIDDSVDVEKKKRKNGKTYTVGGKIAREYRKEFPKEGV